MALPVIFLMGPTASGKTELAVELVNSLSCDIISVDSAMVYRGMDIGTAKPDAAVLARAPHRLIDFRHPAEPYSAAEFATDARRHIADIHDRDRIPLLVGGTMLYFRALEQGLSPLPEAEPAVRERITRRAQRLGWPALHDELARLDPASAARIHPNDSQRIQRALEIHEVSGQARSQQWARRGAPRPVWQSIKMVVAPFERQVLHARIRQRFEAMMRAGLLGEVEKLHADPDLHEGLPAIRAVGYRQLWRHLEGDMPLADAVERGIIATRQLARRQLTWLRAESADVWIDVGRQGWKTTALQVIRDRLDDALNARSA
ncbi:MAG: tRNA (adenosine(37)-N6)-dimethylallyltransferase MiaA [Salinisphaeraceae bacterium]|nr:tRNA (adenosine(37)-N6)-dimethylallyltransferase MiaA [Salinisphaeraceae bacterium]